GIFPAPLAGYVGGDLSAVRWRRVGGGVRQAILPTGKGATARLLHIPAGTAIPDHGHRGMELTLVLQGAFADQGESFGPGDVEISDETVEHRPVVTAGQDCICLAAADAPLRFLGLIPRLAQPFLRI
ncbi:MAG: ChrR family anti-sigma-E factor, partial [Tabrizicola sp.]